MIDDLTNDDLIDDPTNDDLIDGPTNDDVINDPTNLMDGSWEDEVSTQLLHKFYIRIKVFHMI